MFFLKNLYVCKSQVKKNYLSKNELIYIVLLLVIGLILNSGQRIISQDVFHKVIDGLHSKPYIWLCCVGIAGIMTSRHIGSYLLKARIKLQKTQNKINNLGIGITGCLVFFILSHLYLIIITQTLSMNNN